MEQIFYTSMAGLTLPCRLRFPTNAARFPQPDPALPRPVIPPIAVSEEDCAYYARFGLAPAEDPQAEFSVLTANFSDALLPFDRILIHGVALRRQDRAWLICGSPGVGKSTQARFLQELRPGEFSIICGDRPILQLCHSVGADAHIGPHASPVQSLPPGRKVSRPEAVTDEGPILVHPSPWNGKENWHGAEAAPLGGLILLERGEENRLWSLSRREAILHLYSALIHTAQTEELIRRVAALETRILENVPVWRMMTCQVPDSTKLLLDTVFYSGRQVQHEL